jgi:hypothetical protein
MTPRQARREGNRTTRSRTTNKMRTPAKRDCSYYYEDFNRGADIQQCRIVRTKDSAWWRDSDCKKCPVPDIENASGGPHLDLTMTVRRTKFGRNSTYSVTAWCVLHGPIADPYVGCLECAPVIDPDA